MTKRIVGRPFKPGNPGPGVWVVGGNRFLALAAELAAEFGGLSKLSASERLLVEQAGRLVALSEHTAKPDAAIRLASESRRALLALRINRDARADAGPSELDRYLESLEQETEA